jgi:hypothetical protein
LPGIERHLRVIGPEPPFLMVTVGAPRWTDGTLRTTAGRTSSPSR